MTRFDSHCQSVVHPKAAVISTISLKMDGLYFNSLAYTVVRDTQYLESQCYLLHCKYVVE